MDRNKTPEGYLIRAEHKSNQLLNPENPYKYFYNSEYDFRYYRFNTMQAMGDYIVQFDHYYRDYISKDFNEDDLNKLVRELYLKQQRYYEEKSAH